MEENSNSKQVNETKEDKTEKKNRKEQGIQKNAVQQFFENLIAEFRKIIWPSRNELIKQTMVVIIISLFMGALIFGMDAAFNALQSLIASLV